MADFKADVVMKSIMKQVEEAVGPLEADIVGFVKFVYDEIIAASPVITGYYRSNHRIIIRDAQGQFKTQGNPRLSPAQKPEDAEPLSLDFSAETRAEEFGKLGKFKLGDIVTIATNVPYADQVEINHGVYAGAQAIVGA